VIEKKGNQIFIDGVPASEIGAMVARRSQAPIYKLNEVCKCIVCKREKPLSAFDNHRENRKGYFGICRECKANGAALSAVSGM
jgi:hypothetical protein